MLPFHIAKQVAVELEMSAIVLAHAPMFCRVFGAVTHMLASAANILPLMKPSVEQYICVERVRAQALLANVALVGFLLVRRAMLPEAIPTFAAVGRESATTRNALSTSGACDCASFATLHSRIASASLLRESHKVLLNLADRAREHRAAWRTPEALKSAFLIRIASALGHSSGFPTSDAYDDLERIR